jgi:membrane protein
MFGVAGAFAFYGFGALTACLILALATGMDGWLAALIVAVGYGAVAGALALAGRGKIEEGTPPLPERTVENVKEDVEWTKQRAKAGRQ